MPVLERVRRRPEVGVLAAMLIAVGAFPDRMPAPVATLALLGGLVLAMHAIGLLLVYRTDRIINFAQVQIGAVGATFFVLFARYLPLFELIRRACPSCVERVGPSVYRWNYVAAAVLGVAISAVLAWVTGAVLVRRFANAPRLVATVATLFLVPVLGLLQRGMATWLVTNDQRELAGGEVALAAPTAPFRATARWGVAVFGVAEVVTAAVGLVAVVAVLWYLRRTRSGRSLRAVADSADRAATLGLDVARIKGRAWLAAGALSGAAMVTVAMTAGASEAGELGVARMVRILAVAVIARMGSVPLAVVASLVLALFEGGLDWSFNARALVDGLLLIVIAVVLSLQRSDASRAERLREAAWRFGREARPTPSELRDHPTVRAWMRGGAIALALLLLGYPWVMSPSELNLGTVALLLAIVGLSLLVLTGWAGQISLGHMAFAAIGAYVAAISRAPFPVAVPLGALAGAVAALGVGLPALRLRGMHLAVTTLAMALATSALLLDERRLGQYLPDSVARPSSLHLRDDRVFYYLVLAVLALVVIAVVGMRRSRFGRALIGARDNDQAVEAFGIAVVRARLAAFAISGFLAALAGALLVFQQGGLRAATYAPEQSLYAFLWTVIGGLGAISGPLLGAAARGIVDIFSNNQLVQFLAGGVGGMLLLIAMPGGLARVAFDVRDSMLRRLAQRQRIVVPSLLADVRADGDTRVEIAPHDGGRAVGRRYRLDGQWLAEARAGATDG